MARVGSTKIAKAFFIGKPARTKNTETNGTTVWLHHNAIAWWSDGVIHFSLCGWNTVTTRDRLNHIFREAGLPISVCQHKYGPYVFHHGTRTMHEISSRLPYASTDFVN